MAYFSQEFIDFFIELAPNNHKDWFDQNRSRYENFVREPFKQFVQDLINDIAKKEPAFKDVEAKDCIFRINRDIRFSKDKTPYKLNVSAFISPEGRKNKAAKGVYFELTPEHVRVYGGVYEPDKETTYNVRESIAANPTAFKKTYSDKRFKSIFGEILGEKNKVIPKEFKEVGEKEPLIYNKHWYFYTQFEPELILKDDLKKKIIESYEAGKPVQEFLLKNVK